MDNKESRKLHVIDGSPNEKSIHYTQVQIITTVTESRNEFWEMDNYEQVIAIFSIQHGYYVKWNR